MLKKCSLYVFVLLIFCLGESCQRESLGPASDDSAYFPLQIGDYWIYQVTQDTYSSINPVTEHIYQVQEKISSSYNQNGQLFFLMEESIKRTAQSDWQLTTIRTVYKNLTQAVSLDNNVPVVKLVFPIAPTTSWNTNLYNSNPDTLLRYEDQYRSFSLGKLNFENTVSVLGANDSTLVNLEKYRRVYARNIGLVYRENVSLVYCQASADCVGKGIIESGTKQKWELVASNRLP
ncbi:hypothetical protein G8759_23530 [Spirosoma aureum]|uniref:Uncharacterized protein n=1 Tax=Spirosoma aureum TaxID=2692134 RepID=A0A6G9ASD4_9BACT|nr:hypothetical protein [Spirosoma aureum]QIP15387.1 hypothetical protein G8759_23530 [Spirosoma aureum]